MQVNKEIKCCGTVLFIKSILGLIGTVIGLGGGLFFSIAGKLLMKKEETTGSSFENAVANCSTSFFGALGIVFGVMAIIIAVIIGIFSTIYFIHSRKILYSEELPIKSVQILKVLEILGIVICVIGIVGCLISTITQTNTSIYVFMIPLILLLVECIFVTMKLIKITKQIATQKG